MCRAAPGRIARSLPTLQSPRRGTGKRAPRFGLRAVDRFRFSPPRVSGLCIIETTASRGQCNRLKRRIAIARRIRNRFNRSSRMVCTMSANGGQTQTSGRMRARSALLPTTDMRRPRQHVCLVPTTEVGCTNANGGGQPLYRNNPHRVDVRDSLEDTDSPGRLSICGIAGSANHGKIASISCETGSLVTAICAPRKRAPDPRDRSGSSGSKR